MASPSYSGSVSCRGDRESGLECIQRSAENESGQLSLRRRKKRSSSVFGRSEISPMLVKTGSQSVVVVAVAVRPGVLFICKLVLAEAAERRWDPRLRRPRHPCRSAYVSHLRVTCNSLGRVSADCLGEAERQEDLTLHRLYRQRWYLSSTTTQDSIQELCVSLLLPPSPRCCRPCAAFTMALDSFFHNKIESMKLEIIQGQAVLRRLEAQRNDYNSRGTFLQLHL
jgi:26S proteasome regulatory subunit T6